MHFDVSRRRPEVIAFIMEQLRGTHYDSISRRIGASLFAAIMGIGGCAIFIDVLVHTWPLTPDEIIIMAGLLLICFAGGPLIAYIILIKVWHRFTSFDETMIRVTDYGLFGPQTTTISIESIVQLTYDSDRYGTMFLTLGVATGREARLTCTASMNRILHNLPPFPDLFHDEELPPRSAAPAVRIAYLLRQLWGFYSFPYGRITPIALVLGLFSLLGLCIGIRWLMYSSPAGIVVLGGGLLGLLGTLALLRNPLFARRAFSPTKVVEVTYSLLGRRCIWAAARDQICAIAYQRTRRSATLTFYLQDQTTHTMPCSSDMLLLLHSLPAYITDTRITDTPETDAAPD